MGCTRRKVAALTLLATALDRIPAQVSLPVEARLKQLCDAASKGALRLQASAERGRHMVAARDIKAGEAVLTSDCHATVVAADKVSALCGRHGNRGWEGADAMRDVRHSLLRSAVP